MLIIIIILAFVSLLLLLMFFLCRRRLSAPPVVRVGFGSEMQVHMMPSAHIVEQYLAISRTKEREIGLQEIQPTVDEGR